jgi:ribosomal protein S17
MRIEKKVWPEYFENIVEGSKTYELRLADFECRPGDILVLREWDPKTKKYTGRAIEKTVTYVSKTKGQSFWSKEDVEKYGFQVIAFK